MHEIGIANSILEAVRAEAERHPRATPRKVAVRIGELAAVDADALRFGFEVLTRDTELESLELEIEICPRRHRCYSCGAEFNVTDYEFQCPQCGEGRTECIGGDQLELAYLEIDEQMMGEHEPSTA
jgi:hydrogenase nickel incorporation protein HypA/HybF